jgi:hypothetical protein
VAYLIEKAISFKFPVKFLRFLHAVNITAEITISSVVIWVRKPNPAAGVAVLLLATIVLLKIVSYVVENAVARTEALGSKKGSAKGLGSLALCLSLL